MDAQFIIANHDDTDFDTASWNASLVLPPAIRKNSEDIRCPMRSKHVHTHNLSISSAYFIGWRIAFVMLTSSTPPRNNLFPSESPTFFQAKQHEAISQ